ncbi:DMT family transporter [Patescibacteria group bacterium]|nr:DMT family transporter [Patescibacteria group bacterium]
MRTKTRGKLLIFVASIFFSMAALLVKHSSQSFDAYFISLVRFILGFTLGLAYIKASGKKIKLKNKRLLVLRGLYGSAAMILFYVSIGLTSSGRAVLLNNTYPIFVAVLGYYIFRDKVGRSTMASIILCTAGVYLVFNDGSIYPLLGNSLGILSAILSAMAIHYIRRAALVNEPVVVYMSACLAGMVFTLFSIGQADMLTLPTFTILLFIGISTFTGQMFMTHGFKHVSPTAGSVILYSNIPITVAFSYALGEQMTGLFFAGACLIVIGLLANR